MPNATLTSSITEAGTEGPGHSATRWNGLCKDRGPFVDWRFLASLIETGCVGSENGWIPHFVTAGPVSQPRCAAPAWQKNHSHGEFVFDWSWAHAARTAGVHWYPKLLVAVPFTPVTGPRLLGAHHHAEAARQVVTQLEAEVEARQWSSAAVNFCDTDDAGVLRQAGWLERGGWQYHWHNPGYRDFDDFLSALRHKPRKNIRAERRRVRADGWRFRWRDGNTLTAAELDLVDTCYQSTFALYGNLPSLNRAFFASCARRFGPDFLACIAERDQQPLAAAVFWRDRQRLYGRYWGSLVETRDVHFETCYYQGIDYCIRHGLHWFEPGAQGEHKIRRGFLPQPTRSFHYIRHAGLRAAIRRWLNEESAALDSWRRQLDRLDPYAR